MADVNVAPVAIIDSPDGGVNVTTAAVHSLTTPCVEGPGMGFVTVARVIVQTDSAVTTAIVLLRRMHA